MGVSFELKEECHSAMLYDSMNICHLIVKSQWKRQRLRERIGMRRGQGRLIVVLQRVSLTFKTRIGSRIGFLINFLQNFPMLVMIGYLTQILNGEDVLAH